MNAYITQLCKNVIHLLELGDIMVTDRTSLVEKCLNFYNRLLDFKYAGNCMGIHMAMDSIMKLFKEGGGSLQLNPGFQLEPPVFY